MWWKRWEMPFTIMGKQYLSTSILCTIGTKSDAVIQKMPALYFAKCLLPEWNKNTAHLGDFAENWRWRTVFSCVYDILGATKLLVIECRPGDYLRLCPIGVTKGSLGVLITLFTSPLSIYSQGCCFCSCRSPTSAFSYHHLQERSLNFCLV